MHRTIRKQKSHINESSEISIKALAKVKETEGECIAKDIRRQLATDKID